MKAARVSCGVVSEAASIAPEANAWNFSGAPRVCIRLDGQGAIVSDLPPILKIRRNGKSRLVLLNALQMNSRSSGYAHEIDSVFLQDRFPIRSNLAPRLHSRTNSFRRMRVAEGYDVEAVASRPPKPSAEVPAIDTGECGGCTGRG
jgi:hypothetical protein